MISPWRPTNARSPCSTALARLARCTSCRTSKALRQAITAGLVATTLARVRAFFAHGGFPLRDHSIRKPVSRTVTPHLPP